MENKGIVYGFGCGSYIFQTLVDGKKHLCSGVIKKGKIVPDRRGKGQYTKIKKMYDEGFPFVPLTSHWDDRIIYYPGQEVFHNFCAYRCLCENKHSYPQLSVAGAWDRSSIEDDKGKITDWTNYSNWEFIFDDRYENLGETKWTEMFTPDCIGRRFMYRHPSYTFPKEQIELAKEFGLDPVISYVGKIVKVYDNGSALANFWWNYNEITRKIYPQYIKEWCLPSPEVEQKDDRFFYDFGEFDGQ
jgi:hypothetical protein